MFLVLILVIFLVKSKFQITIFCHIDSCQRRKKGVLFSSFFCENLNSFRLKIELEIFFVNAPSKKKSTPRCGLSKNTRAAVPRCMQCTISRQNPLSTAFGKLRSINTHFVTQLLLWSLSFVHFLEESIFILLLYILLSR